VIIGESKVHLQGLNGLRAIAALSVVIAHISLEGIADFGLPNLSDLPMAGFGVTLFFVISGFLITYLLLQEVNKTSNVDIKKFYIRRILRIWPIYYLFIFICVGVFFIMKKPLDFNMKEMWFYIFFAANIPFIFQQGIVILVHYWSIGVEEQFYLFWPLIIKISKNKLFKITVLIFFILFLTKMVFWWYFGHGSFAYRFLSVTRFHCMMIGAIGAILYFNKNIRFIKLFSNKIVQLLSWMLFLLMGLNFIYIPVVVSQEIIAIASLSMIIGQITVNNRIINLEKTIFDFIGKISYGIYIIHPLIILLISKLYKNLNFNQTLKYLIVYLSVVFVTIVVAWLSYNFYEKPFLKLKNKFAVVNSSNSMSFQTKIK
jgi:peptidoglycan/LPS O-acetylase OafA/YrhL